MTGSYESPISQKSVLVSDDDAFFRVALGNILKRNLGIPEVVETDSFDRAIECLDDDSDIGLALFDLNMPGMNNWVNLQTVRTSYPDLRVSVVSASRDRHDILMALGASLHGYIYKGLGILEMKKALRLICEGTIYVPPLLAELPPSSPPSAESFVGGSEHKNDQSIPSLTPRQKEVLALLAAGKSNKAMARSLRLSEGTVKFHVAAVFRLLGVTNRVEAATTGSKLLQLWDEKSRTAITTETH